MKRLLATLFIALFLCGQAFAEVPFDVFKKAIVPSVPQGFVFASQQARMMQARYSSHASEMDTLTYELHVRQKAFSKMDELLGASHWEWQGHAAIFINGARTGMSVVAIKLKSDAGMLYITNRVFGGKAMTLEQFKRMLAKIDMASIGG